MFNANASNSRLFLCFRDLSPTLIFLTKKYSSLIHGCEMAALHVTMLGENLPSTMQKRRKNYRTSLIKCVPSLDGTALWKLLKTVHPPRTNDVRLQLLDSIIETEGCKIETSSSMHCLKFHKIQHKIRH